MYFFSLLNKKHLLIGFAIIVALVVVYSTSGGFLKSDVLPGNTNSDPINYVLPPLGGFPETIAGPSHPTTCDGVIKNVYGYDSNHNFIVEKTCESCSTLDMGDIKFAWNEKLKQCANIIQCTDEKRKDFDALNKEQHQNDLRRRTQESEISNNYFYNKSEAWDNAVEKREDLKAQTERFNKNIIDLNKEIAIFEQKVLNRSVDDVLKGAVGADPLKAQLMALYEAKKKNENGKDELDKEMKALDISLGDELRRLELEKDTNLKKIRDEIISKNAELEKGKIKLFPCN